MPSQATSQDSHLARNFYEDALTEAERTKLKHVRGLDGLEEEIAFLRLRLERLAKAQPEKLELLMKGMGLLLRLVSVQYKLSPAARDNLADSLAKVVNEITSAFMTEGH